MSLLTLKIATTVLGLLALTAGYRVRRRVGLGRLPMRWVERANRRSL